MASASTARPRASGRSRARLPRLTEEEQRAWGGFLRAHADLVRQLDRELEASHGLPLRSYDVLIQLARSTDHSLRMSDLADAIVLSRSGLTRLVDRLVAEGYVERRRCPSDARGALATLTPAGFERVRDAAGTHLDSVRRLFLDVFSTSELEALGSYWERLYAGVEAGAPEPDAPVRGAP